MIDGVIGAAPTGAVVVGVDDAHLLDDLSAFAVHQLVSRKLATVVLTLRSGEPAPDAITAIWKDDVLERIELQPLSSSVIAKLVERILGGPVHSRCVQQLWQYTQGNVLYLRHLLDTEVSAGRLTQQSGVWMWQGQPRLTPTLAELLTTRIGQIPAAARNVLDALVITEPLDIETLAAVTDSEAITETEALGLIRIRRRPDRGVVAGRRIVACLRCGPVGHQPRRAGRRAPAVPGVARRWRRLQGLQRPGQRQHAQDAGSTVARQRRLCPRRFR